MRALIIVTLPMVIGSCDRLFELPAFGRVDASQGGIDSRFQDARVGTTGPRIVFVTSDSYAAGALDMGLGGLSGADDACQARASMAGLPGAYAAWLSSNTESPQLRMTHGGGPFVLTDKVTHVAETWTLLTGSNLQHPIDRTEAGDTIIGGGCDVWTNTKPNGLIESVSPVDDCYDWSSLDQGGPQIMGSVIDIDARWTQHFLCGTNCMATARLYCVQQ